MTDKRETEKEFLTRILPELEGRCEYWACEGPDKPFVPMMTCYVCGTVMELRERLEML